MKVESLINSFCDAPGILILRNFVKASECVFGLHNDLRWPPNGQMRVFSFPDKRGTSPMTLGGGKNT